MGEKLNNLRGSWVALEISHNESKQASDHAPSQLISYHTILTAQICPKVKQI